MIRFAPVAGTVIALEVERSAEVQHPERGRMRGIFSAGRQVWRSGLLCTGISRSRLSLTDA
jgi:hypothetical protein